MYGAKRENGDLFIPFLEKDGQGRIGVGKIDSDLLFPLEVELEPIALVLLPTLIKNLLHLTGIIFHSSKRRFHFLDDGKDLIFLCAFC